MTRDRGRITLPDLMHFLAAMAVLGALWPVAYTLLSTEETTIGTGELLLWQSVLPVALIVMLAIIWRKAAGGAL